MKYVVPRKNNPRKNNQGIKIQYEILQINLNIKKKSITYCYITTNNVNFGFNDKLLIIDDKKDSEHGASLSDISIRYIITSYSDNAT